jgi:DNA replication and repair protein RecF
MRVTVLQVRDFRSYERADVALGPGLTIIHGANGAGKTNLLEALFFGCTGRSCRTSNERDMVRFGASAARVVVDTVGADGPHRLSVGFQPGEPKRMQVDGAPVERVADSPARPLINVFLPDRLELVKGPPGLRRAHLDQFVAALWPARRATRHAYSQALAQRNALLAAIRAGRASMTTLRTWDAELARHAVPLRDDRGEAITLLGEPFAAHARELGLEGEPQLEYRPRSRAPDANAFVAELQERRAGELERGFSAHGPHRDDVALLRDGRELRAYGSQGEQRLALLALLLAERDALAASRDDPPLLLLDDVMSELDADRRALLSSELARGGQSVVTATELDHVPAAAGEGVVRLRVADGSVLSEAPTT